MSLLDDTFTCTDIDPDGRKFDQVTRLLARSLHYELFLTLDVHSLLYPVSLQDRFQFSLSVSPQNSDAFDYVMFGTVYKLEESSNKNVALYVSFGGLLMRLEGEVRQVGVAAVGSKVYLMLRRL